MSIKRFNYLITPLGGVLFLFFAYLQINDQDSLIWIIAYLIPAVLSLLALTDYRSKYLQYISPIYLIIALYLYWNNSDTDVMYIFNKTTNESLGLVLCSVWIFILPWLSYSYSPTH